MLNSNIDGKFNVIDAEWGVGKTTAIIDVIPHFVASTSFNRSLK
jgi:hypothetical protein